MDRERNAPREIMLVAWMAFAYELLFVIEQSDFRMMRYKNPTNTIPPRMPEATTT